MKLNPPERKPLDKNYCFSLLCSRNQYCPQTPTLLLLALQNKVHNGEHWGICDHGSQALNYHGRMIPSPFYHLPWTCRDRVNTNTDVVDVVRRVHQNNEYWIHNPFYKMELCSFCKLQKYILCREHIGSIASYKNENDDVWQECFKTTVI